MFGLRSSPSTLMPCSLRGAVAAEAGMGFGARGLTVPRPKRVVMPIVYYDPGCAYSPGVSGGAGGGNNGTGSTSDYAGVFESGCDPAQVRASLQSRTPIARPLEEEPYGGNGYYNNVIDDDSSDCLFQMDGAEGHPKDAISDFGRDTPFGMSGLGSCDSRMSGEATSVAIGRAMPITGSEVRTGPGGGVFGYDGGHGGSSKRGTPMGAPAAGATPPSTRSDGLSVKSTHLRRAPPRPLASGRRCVAPNMYRLRLSTSC